MGLVTYKNRSQTRLFHNTQPSARPHTGADLKRNSANLANETLFIPRNGSDHFVYHPYILSPMFLLKHIEVSGIFYMKIEFLIVHQTSLCSAKKLILYPYIFSVDSIYPFQPPRHFSRRFLCLTHLTCSFWYHPFLNPWFCAHSYMKASSVWKHIFILFCSPLLIASSTRTAWAAP